MIDIYKCLSGGATPTKGVPKTCDTTWYDSAAVEMYIWEKTLNVKYYEQPIGSAHSRIDILVPATTLRFQAALQIKWLDLYTDIGKFADNWQKDQIPTIQNFKNTTSEWSMKNIVGNFASQGRVIMADF
jgi:hypothetical protein